MDEHDEPDWDALREGALAFERYERTRFVQDAGRLGVILLDTLDPLVYLGTLTLVWYLDGQAFHISRYPQDWRVQECIGDIGYNRSWRWPRHQFPEMIHALSQWTNLASEPLGYETAIPRPGCLLRRAELI